MGKRNSVRIKILFRMKSRDIRQVFLLFITPVLLMQIQICDARQITTEQSLAIAQQFYNKHHVSNSARVKSSVASDFRLNYVCTGTHSSSASRVKAEISDSTVYFYVYNIGDKGGFVIISGDDATKQVLAYSDEAVFRADSIPSNLQYWLNYYQSEIKYAKDNALSTLPTDSITLTKSVGSTSGTTVSPLLGNIKWDQSYPYNLLCPYITSDNARSVTGCVATAMAQIMRYYRWPVKGTGSFSYTDGTNGTLSANFANTTYDWSNMPENYSTDSSTTVQDTAVARLMFHCGVAVSMSYGTDGSSAYVSNAAGALKNYFGYDTDITIHDREFYSSSDWKSLIKTELDAERPVLYSGTTDTEGHAFICDGYDVNDMFHINWGWGGYYNGYFELSVLNPAMLETTGTTGGFSQNQEIVTEIQKPDGITNPDYEINMYSNGLSSTSSSLSSITSKTFSVSFGFLNYGITSFSGKIGIGLYKDGIFQKTLATNSSNTSLSSYYGTSSNSLSGLSLSGLSSGTYQIYCIFKSSSATTWSIMKGTNELNNYLNVVVNGTTATISKPSLTPVLALTQAVSATEKLYKNKTANFDVTVQNTGNDFYSNMGIKLISSTNTAVYQYIGCGLVCIPAGETKNFTFSDTVTCATGSYYAVVICDSTNALSTNNYTQLTPTAYNGIAVTVLSEPVAAVLSLTTPVSLSTGLNTISQNELISLSTTITNTGGYFDSQIAAFVFKSTGGSSVACIDPKIICIDTNESRTVTFTDSLDLNPGSYFFILYYYSGGWVKFTPAASAKLVFTVTPGLDTSTIDIVANGFTVHPNPVTDAFYLKDFTGTALLAIRDIRGRIVLTKIVKAEESVSVGSLPQGIYILSLTTKEGTNELKLIKK